MNILPHEKQVEIISALCEGVSIRATERLTDVHRDTIMRLGVRVGQGCKKLHDAVMRDLSVPRIEFDEIWSFVGKKQAKRKVDDDPMLGDSYTFIALAGATKAILSYRVARHTLSGKTYRPYATTPVHSADQCVQQEIREPRSSRQPLCQPLQFLPCP